MNTNARAAGLLFSGALLWSVSAFPMGEHAMPNKITAAQSAAAANLRQDMRSGRIMWYGRATTSLRRRQINLLNKQLRRVS